MNSSRFQYVSADLYRQIQKILPSGDGRQESYRPARVVLRDGKQLDYVCMIEASSYIQTWGVWPEDDSGKEQVSFDDIVSIEESSSRLPPAIANKLYKAGESGMGYCIFTLVFDDGTEQVCTSGNLIDFIKYPKGKSGDNIVDVKPHSGRDAERLCKGPDYLWAIYALPGANP